MRNQTQSAGRLTRSERQQIQATLALAQDAITQARKALEPGTHKQDARRLTLSAAFAVTDAIAVMNAASLRIDRTALESQVRGLRIRTTKGAQGE